MFLSDKELEAVMRNFLDESLDLLIGMEDALMQIRENGISTDDVNAVFRAAHTIKGSAGMLKLNHLVEFTHIAENLLDAVRNNKISIDESMITLLLQVKDHMEQLILFYVQNIGQEPDQFLIEKSEQLKVQLQSYMESPIISHSTSKQEPEIEQDLEILQDWYVSIEFDQSIFMIGMDPVNFIRYLSKIGEISNFVLNTQNIPSISNINPEECYISCSFDIDNVGPKEKILEVFEFIQDDIKIQIDPKNRDFQELHSQEELQQEVFDLQVQTAQSSTPVNKTTPTDAEPTVSIASSSTLRVDSDKIDVLINLIGEMVIANANVVQRASVIQDGGLNESVSAVSRMLEEIRESAMKIRMVQIGETFGKFKRIVYDVSAKLNKSIELVINGGDTEMDKTIVEKISDPLIHIVRNAIDHGLENSEQRIAAGKNPKGKLELNAYHDAGTIAIEVIDDGRGLDENKIFAKAVERGIVDENAKLSQREIFNLIFEPGFSTAEAITDLSGRGVGMDVVRRNIESLRGSVEIRSNLGKGSAFILRLPLTLAIIDGFLVKVGSTHYVIPLDMVLECIELSPTFYDDMHGNNYINLRGAILPLLNVREHFSEHGERRSRRDNIVVVQYADTRFGLIVEELHGEFQTVIKPLGKIFRAIKGVSGSTILGTGEVALILDIPTLINHILTLQAKDS